MRKSSFCIAGLSFIYIFSLVLAYSTTIIPEQDRLLVQDLIYFIAPLAALVSGIYAVRKFGMESLLGRTIFFFTLGYLLWFIGEIIWTVDEIVLHIEPTGSIADIFYLAAYPLFIIGILAQKDLGLAFKDTRKNILGAIAIAILLAFTIYLYALAYNPSSPLQENVLFIAYGIADTVIIIGLAIMINLSMRYRAGALGKAWALLALGFAAQWVADLLLAFHDKSYDQSQWISRQIDYFWIAHYLLAAYAFYLQTKTVDNAIQKGLLDRLAKKSRRKAR